MVMNVDTLCRCHRCYHKKGEADHLRQITRLFCSGQIDLGIQLLILNHSCDYPSSRPPELSAPLVLPADKLARERLWPIECEGSYDVPGVLWLRKQAFCLLAYETLVNVRCHVDATNVSDSPLHLRPRKSQTRSTGNVQTHGHLYPLYRAVLRLTLSCPSLRWPMS
jgi:hypothetical protein